MLALRHQSAGDGNRRGAIGSKAAIVQRLDRRLGAVEFVAGALSIADFAILAWAWRHERHQVDLADFPNVRRWYDVLMARPAVQRGFDVALS